MTKVEKFLRKIWRFTPVLLLLSPLAPLFGLDLTVPRLEIVTRGKFEDNKMIFSTSSMTDIALNGGYRYSALLGFSFISANLEKALSYQQVGISALPDTKPLMPGGTPAKLTDTERIENLEAQYNALVDRYENQAVLSFRIVKATARDLFNLPLEMTYFAGIADEFCSGDEFIERFGTASIGSIYRGFYYFPDGINGNITRQYNGIHGVRGTGLSFGLSPWEFVYPMVYLYQDFSFVDPLTGLMDPGHFSGDARVLINFPKVKIESFMGTTLAADTSAKLRGGILSYVTPFEGIEFLFEIGVPGWTADDGFTIDNLLFLMEPRINFGLVNVAMTFFYHPMEYLQILTPQEQGTVDINLQVMLGNVNETALEGGLDITTTLQNQGSMEVGLHLSPFFGFVTSGLHWNTRIRINPLVKERPSGMFEIFLGIKTAL